jgi:hypothetical protein
MVKKTYKTEKELEFLFNGEGSLEFSRIIVEKCLLLVGKKFKEELIMKLTVLETDTTYEIMVESQDLKETLEVNLDTLLDYEEYELCSKVQNAINQLSN